MDRLRQALDQLRQGRGGIATLIGDAGLGKSRLIEELRGEWMREMGLNGGWIEGRGISFEASRPYGLFRQYLLQTCNIEESDPPGIAREKILCAVVDLSRLQVGERNETLQAITLLQSPEENSVNTGSLEGEALKRELFREASEIFLQLGGQKPMVVVGDDLHWADPASIELLIHLFQLSEQIPILFLCALRPYRNISGWQVKPAAEQDYPHRYTEVTLHALSDLESNAMVDGLLAVAELPVELRRLVLRKAEGNPFFVEELIRNLIENQVVVRDASGLRWQAVRQVEEISLPDSIHALLAGRIDRLDKETRHVLQLAAVIGRSFPYSVLQNISDPGIALDSQLNILERAGLIWETARLPEREYTFRHELTAEAAYESILHRRRREYHRRVAEAFEALYPAQLENRAFLLAMHFDKALEREYALKYYTLAGDVAARLYANMEATHHYSRAIQIAHEIGTPEQLITLYLHLGHALQNSGQNLEALARYRELEVEGETRQDPRMSLSALIPQATLHAIPSAVFDRAEAEKLSQRALELARQLEDHSAEARSLWNMMIMVVMDGGDLNEAINQGQQALAITRQYDLKEEQAYVLHDLARAYIYAGRADEGQVVLDEAKRLWRASGNQAMLADSLGNEGLGYALQGEYEKATQSANEGLAVARAIDNPWGVAYNLMALGMVYYETGEVSRSIETFKEVQRFGEESAFIAAQVYSIILVSWIYGIYGDPGRGLQKIQELPGSHQNLASPVRNLANIGELYLHLLNEDLDKAMQTLGDYGGYDYLMMVDLYYNHYNPYGMAVPGEFALANGDLPKALAYAEKALAVYKHRRQSMNLPDLYNLKGKILLRMGQQEQALQLLEQARQLAKESGARRSLWKVLLTLLKAYQQLGDREGEQSTHRQVHELAQFFLSQMQDEALRNKFLEKYGGLILPLEERA